MESGSQRVEGQAAAGASPRTAVSIVIPCYRDASGLEQVFQRVGAVMDALPGPAELVLIDDGSPDGTGRCAVELARPFRHRTVVVRLARNFGQHPAVFAGLAHASGDVVVTLDSDLQYPPEQIPELIANLDAEHPVVSGSREQRNDPRVRRVITRVLSWWLGRRTGVHLRDVGSMFRAYERAVVDELLRFTEQRRFVPALVAWLGVGVREIPVRHAPRGEAGSRYRLSSLVDMFLDLITGYSIAPLRLVAALGLVGSLFGFAATVAFAVYRIAIGAGISGLVSAFALLFALAAIQLLLLALLSEYVGRIYVETRSRPYYLIGEVTTNR